MKEELFPVKIPKALISRIDRIVENVRDSFGLRKFRSRNEFVTEAVKRFLKEFEQGALSAFINDVLRNKSLVDQIRPKVILKSIYFGDERFLYTSDQQLLNLLLSTYRSALQAYQRYYHFKFEFNKLQKQLSHKTVSYTHLTLPTN